jgi:hypothetical protein
MTFAGYNAGRGRVRDWVKLRGDPRDPNVDAVDWVERIPFSETRNYVQRVIENLGVYRVRFGTGTSAPAMAKKDDTPALAAKPESSPKPDPAPALAAKPEPAPALAARPEPVPAMMKPQQAPAPGPATAAAQAAPASGQANASVSTAASASASVGAR